MGFSNGVGPSNARKTYTVDSLNAIFNIPVQTHIVGRSLDHHITIQYGGSKYPCGRDDASIRSVHTIDSDDDEHIASPRSGISRGMRGSYTSLLSPLKRAVDSQKCLKATEEGQSKKYRSWLPSWAKTTTKTKPAQSRQSSLPGISKRLSLYQPLQNNKRSGNKLKRKSGQVSNDQQVPRLQTQSTSSVFPQQSYFYPSSTIYAPQGYLPYGMNYYAPQYAQVQPNPACPSTVQHPSPNGAADAKETPAIANRIQTVQQSIDLAKSKLEKDSNNLLLQGELSQLKSKLNHMLDTVIKRSAPFTRENCVSKPVEDEPHVTIQRKTHQTECNLKAAGTEAHEEHRLEQPAQPTASCHTCSNCDAVRSKSFHSRHPYTPGQKPVHNLCKSCRASGMSVRVLNRYHFCSNCGIVRSKEYHRSHAQQAPVLLSRNLCSKCAKTSRYAHIINRELPSEHDNSKSDLHSDTEANTLPKARDFADLPAPQTVQQATSPAVDLPLASPYLPKRRIGSAQRRAERVEPERERLSKSLNLDGSPSMKQYQPPSAETISPTSDDSAAAKKDTSERNNSPVEYLLNLSEKTHLAKSVAQKSPLISPPLPETTVAQRFGTKTSTNESQSRPGSNHSDDSFKSSSGVFHKWPSPTTQHWPHLNQISKANNQAHPSTKDKTTSADESCYIQPQPSLQEEQPRFSKGAFDRLSSTLPQSSPWLNPNSPKRSTYTANSCSSSSNGPETTTSCYYTRPPHNNNSNKPHLNQTSIFESYATSSTDADTGTGFESTRGAWSLNSNNHNHNSNTRRGPQERVPEPIIEEPPSPVLSAVRTPLLLEFDVSDLSESSDSSAMSLAQHDDFAHW